MKAQWFDSDAHIEEGPEIWDHLDVEFRHRAPQIVDVSYEGKHQYRDKAWLIDGKIRPHNSGVGPVNHSSPAVMTWAKMKPASVESQMMVPVAARLRDMDAMGIHTQVNYPTVFLEHLSNDRNLEAALMRAWNRSMAEKSRAAPARLKWVAMIPWWDAAAARKEIEWAKGQGAAGVYTLGSVYDTFLNDRLFDPVYDICQELEMPVCVHVGWPHQGMNNSCDSMLASFLFVFEHSMLWGLFAFIAGGILDRFPRLKVGFFEGPIGAYLGMLERLEHWRIMDTAQTPISTKPPRAYLEECEVYFSCEGDETHLRPAIDTFGAHRILLTSDFPHVHFENSELCSGMDVLDRHQDISAEEKALITNISASKFYSVPLPANLGLAAEARRADEVFAK